MNDFTKRKIKVKWRWLRWKGRNLQKQPKQFLTQLKIQSKNEELEVPTSRKTDEEKVEH
jgi:hypothetical protein